VATAQTATTVIQEARATFTPAIFTDVSDDAAAEAVSGEAAEGALAYLAEMSPDLRGAALLEDGGAVLAATGDRDRWARDCRALFEAADRAGEEPVEQVHIGTTQGEVFAVRHAGFSAVAVTDRFALASLTFFDLRSLLRDLAGGGPLR
jgi:hypothetical protein